MAKAKQAPEADERSASQQLADQEATEFLGEEVKNGQVVNVPEEVVDDKPDEKPETEEEAPAPPPPPPAIDQEKLKAELSAAVAEELAAKLRPETPQVDPDDVPPWEKEGRTPRDWAEVTEFSTHQAMKRLNAEIEADNAKAQEEAKAQQDAETARLQAYNSMWDEELQALRDAGKLPAIADANDTNDPGRQAQMAILQQMVETNQARQAEGKPPIMSIAAFHNLYYKNPTAQPAGANAPVSLSRKSVSQPEPGQYSYQDIHNTPWEAFETPSKNS